MATHPTSVIEKGAQIAPDAEIGPFCFVGPGVKIGSGCRLLRSVTVLGNTRIGSRNVFHPFCVIGGEPQDFKYRGEDSETVIGNDNVFRENVTVNKGTAVDENRTVIGDRNYFMACCHIAHDTIIEDECLLANQSLLSGHIHVQQGAIISGQTALHHFVTVGLHSFVGGCSRINQDVPPFMIVQGMDAEVHGVNTIGLRRRGFKPAAINALREAHRLIWRSGLPKTRALDQLETQSGSIAEIRTLIEFLRASDQGRLGRAREVNRPGPIVPGESGEGES
ncbi:MAG: acyl-ACP--UDP-N-acetylglucosamine O-acyltransferase [Planctomycetota bacterium]